MQIVINKDFSVAQLVPSMVFQNSVNASYLDIFAPFNVREYASVGVNIELPSGEYVEQTLAFPAPGQPYDYGLWTTPLDAKITALQGVVRFSLVFNGANETATTGIAELNVRRTAVPVLPSAPASDVYQQILTQLSALQAYYGDMDVSVEQIYNDLIRLMKGESFERNVMDIPLLPGRINGTSDLKYAHTRDAQQNIPGSKIYFDDTNYSLTVYVKLQDGSFDAIKAYTVSPAVIEDGELYPEVYYELWKRTTGDMNIADAQASLYRDNVYTNFLLTIAEAAATYRRIDDSYSKDEVDSLIFDMPSNALGYTQNIWDSNTRVLKIYTLDRSRYVQADLSDMYTKTQIGVLLNGKVNNEDFNDESRYVRSHAIGMLQYNASTGVISYSTLDGSQSGNIDLPVESLVESGYFDEATEELVLVLTSGDEIRIPVAGLLNPVWVTDVSQGGDQPPTATAVLNALNNLNAQLSSEISKKANTSDVYTKLQVDDVVQELNSKILSNATEITDIQDDVTSIKLNAVKMPEASNNGYDLTFTTLSGTSKTFTNPAEYDKYSVPVQEISLPNVVYDSYGGYLGNIVIQDEPRQYSTPSATNPATIFEQEFLQTKIGCFGKNLLNYKLAENEDSSPAKLYSANGGGFYIPASASVTIPVLPFNTNDMNTVTVIYGTPYNVTWNIVYTDGTSSKSGLKTRSFVTIPNAKKIESIKFTNNVTREVYIYSVALYLGEANSTYEPYIGGEIYTLNFRDINGSNAPIRNYDEIRPGGTNGYQLLRKSYKYTLQSDALYYPYPSQNNPTGVYFYVEGVQGNQGICTHGKPAYSPSSGGASTTVTWSNILTELGFTTTDEFKTWLQTNQVNLIIKSNEPIETIELSENTCNSLKSIEVLKGYSNIYQVYTLTTEIPGAITADYRVDIQEYAKTLVSEKNEHHYTVRWNQSTSKMERLNDAANITTDTSNFGYFGEINPNYNNPFDNIYPWSGIKLCNIDIPTYMALKPGDSVTKCVTAWEGETGYSEMNSHGLWRYRPEFWGRSWESGIYRYFDVTDKPLGGYVHYPEAIVGKWFGRHTSISGVSPQCLIPSYGIPARRLSLSTLHAYAKNYGATIDSIYSIDADILLYVVEYANINSQRTLGNGVSNLYRVQEDFIQENVTSSNKIQVLSSDAKDFCIEDAIIDIGTTVGGIEVGSYSIESVEQSSTNPLYLDVTISGNVTVTTSNYWSIKGLKNVLYEGIGSKSGYIGINGKSNAYYRGIVLYGNFWTYTLGAYENPTDNHIWIATDDEQADEYDALDTSVHIDTGLVLPTTNGYIQKLGITDNSIALSIPPFCTEIGGNSTNPVGDGFANKSTTSSTVLVRSAGANLLKMCGALYNRFDLANSYSSPNTTARPRLKNP